MTNVSSSSNAALDAPAQYPGPCPGAGTATTEAALPGSGNPRKESCGPAVLEGSSVVTRDSSRDVGSGCALKKLRRTHDKSGMMHPHRFRVAAHAVCGSSRPAPQTSPLLCLGVH